MPYPPGPAATAVGGATRGDVPWGPAHHEAFDRLIEQGLTTEQFELTRQFLSKYSSHFAPTTAARLGYAIDDAFYGIEGEGHLAKFKAMMGELALDDVNSAIERHWQTESLCIAIVTGDADRLTRELTSGQLTPIDYPNPMADSGTNADPGAGAVDRWPGPGPLTGTVDRGRGR